MNSHTGFSKESQEKARLEVQWINHQLDSDPNHPGLWFNKATWFDQAMHPVIPERTRLERTLLWFRQCLGKWELQWAAYYNSANVLRRLNRHEEALTYAKEACCLNPNSNECKKLLEMTRVRLGVADSASLRSTMLNPDSNATGKDFNLLETESMVRNIYRDRESAVRAILQGKVQWVMEMADPELACLQFDAEALLDLDLADIAEDVCIQYQLLNGHNNLIDSLLVRIGLLERGAHPKPERDPHLLAGIAATVLHPDASLLDLLARGLPRELREVADAVSEVPALFGVFTASEIDRCDDRIRWLFDTIQDFRLNVRDPNSKLVPIPPYIRRIEAKAILNFLIARRRCLPASIAFTAATLAQFFEHFEGSKLPYLLYSIAANESAKAKQSDYCVFAHGRCALLLMEEQRYGVAISHLLQALSFADSCQRIQNTFQAYTSLCECYSRLGVYDQALTYAKKASELPRLPAHLKEEAELRLIGLQSVAKGEVASVGSPPVVIKGLTLGHLTFEGPLGLMVFQYTSKHELYDSLLQYYDGLMQMAQTLTERDVVLGVLRKTGIVGDLTAMLALDLKLPFNGLLHLETYKAVLLRRRLKCLPVRKPEGVPQELWTQLQKLVEMYRSATEQPHGKDSAAYRATNHRPEQVLDTMRQLIWKASLFSGVGASPIAQRFPLGDVPASIECAAPETTTILVFACGPDKGYCLFLSPKNCHAPESIELPKASIAACHKLSECFTEILESFLSLFEHSQADPTLGSRFDDFTKEFDQIFYLPLRECLEEKRCSRICVVEDRRMRALPIGLLGHGCGDGPLCLRYDLSFSPSLSVVASLSTRPSTRPETALIVADAVPECPVHLCDNSNRDCFGLEGSRSEAAHLTELFAVKKLPTSVLLGQVANCAAVTELIPKANLIHIACHGFFFANEIESSGVLLSSDSAKNSGVYVDHDHQLTENPERAVGQMLTLRHAWEHLEMTDCALLNLAGCSTGLVDWKEPSDEFYGLANGFLYAGAQTVIATQWPILDLPAMVFNRLFYESLLNGSWNPVGALRTATDLFRSIEVDEFTRLAGIADSGDAQDFLTSKQLKLMRSSGLGQTTSNCLHHPLIWGCYRVIGRLD